MTTESLPLRDIHLPMPVGIWPLAPGWWCLVAALIAATAVILFLIQRYRRPTALKQALAEVDRLFGLPEIANVQRNQEISLILKKLAVTTYPREDVAGLAGEEWIDWVKSRADGASYSAQILSFLRYGPYCTNEGIIENKDQLQSELHQLLTSVASMKKTRIFMKRIRQSKKAMFV